MIGLSASLSAPLIELICAGQVKVDAVEASPYFTPQQIQAYRDQVPGMPFFFHGGNLIMAADAWQQAETYLSCTTSPWLSVHISMWPPDIVQAVQYNGKRPPPLHPRRAIRRLVENVLALQEKITVPIILENMAPLTESECENEAAPAVINEVLEKTGCDLLLDIAHARVAAAALQIDVHHYLADLLLSRVVQIHTNGPRHIRGRLQDAHEPLLEIDYALLAWVLEQTTPHIITLEYYQRRDALCEQLRRLENMVA